MKKKISYFLASAMLAISGVSYAQDKFSERAEIVKAYNTNINLGWYTGVVDNYEIRDLINRFLPLSNFLSRQLNSVVVIETDKSDKEIATDAKKGLLSVVYTSGLMASQLVKDGWTPIVGRSENIKAVLVAKKDFKYASPKDLQGKKIIAASGATVTYYAQYSLIENKVLKSKEDSLFSSQKLNQGQLLDFLKNGQADLIVVRDTIAAKIIKDNPSYKIVYNAKEAPGHMLLVSPAFAPEKATMLKQIFLSLTPENEQHKNILSGLDGFQANDLKPFKEVSKESLELSDKVVSSLELPKP